MSATRALIVLMTVSAGVGCAGPQDSRTDAPAWRTVEAEVDAEAAARYLLSHQRSNGAFGPAGHDHTDLAWNYPAVHGLVLLKKSIPKAEDCFRNGSGALYKLRGSHDINRAWDVYQRACLSAAMGRAWSGEPDLRGRWTLEFKDRQGHYYFKIADAQLKARTAPFCDIPTLATFIEAIITAGGTVANPEVARDYFLSRQTESGAFVDAYKAGSSRQDSEAHVMATSQAVLALKAIGSDLPGRDECVSWLRSCQDQSGGFRWSPSDSSPSNQADVWYTWAAVRALDSLGSAPRDRDRCLKWLNSLQNSDGGFADRPGWNSRLYSTYYAIHALKILAGDAVAGIAAKTARTKVRVIPEGRYSIFQAHLKSPPGGREMVDAVKAMGFSLVAVKDNSPDSPKVPVSEARAYAREQGVPLEVVSCPEQYGHKLLWLGGHPANHVANYLVPPDMTPEQVRRVEGSDAAGRQGLEWKEFRKQVIAPVLGMGSLFYPELDYEMTNAYMVYDDGLEGGAGYNAVIGGLGWPVWDWIRFFPYRERWVGRHPIIVDGDAHGDLAKWGERMDRQRLLYLAPSHGLGPFVEACRDARTVCVIRGGADKDELALYGDPAVVDYVKRHRSQWQWW